MKLWRISQTRYEGYDIYDSAVVASETEDGARNIHPGGYKFGSGAWADTPEQVDVEYLGEAAEGIAEGVIVASFNAG